MYPVQKLETYLSSVTAATNESPAATATIVSPSVKCFTHDPASKKQLKESVHKSEPII